MLGSPTRYFSLNRNVQTTPQRRERDGVNRCPTMRNEAKTPLNFRDVTFSALRRLRFSHNTQA